MNTNMKTHLIQTERSEQTKVYQINSDGKNQNEK